MSFTALLSKMLVLLIFICIGVLCSKLNFIDENGSAALNKLVLYAPILCGLGSYDITDAFHYNTWEHAADDFQLDENGNYDLTITDPVVIEMYCSSCWHYDRDYSPNGGRRDLCVAASEKLIDLDAIQAQTLVICGSKDPYLDFDLVNASLEHLPEDAVIVAESRDKGGSLVTASIALDYNREVFAFPGRCNDDRSKGCNRLIRLNRAGLITCAKDLLEALGWENKSTRTSNALQQSIPFVEENLSPSSRLILDALRQHGDLRITQLNDLTGLDNIVLIEELLNLEMDGKIRSCPGGLYQLR